MSEATLVRIDYRRPPDRLQVFEQWLVHDAPDVKVTFAPSMDFGSPMLIEGEVVLENGSDIVWFTFPGAWHDIGRFHRADGAFTGIYANVLTPPVLDGLVWQTTDLFLDVWIDEAGQVSLLDEAELDEAVGKEWLDAAMGDRAREEAWQLMAAAKDGAWPPDVVKQWTRERCLEILTP